MKRAAIIAPFSLLLMALLIGQQRVGVVQARAGDKESTLEAAFEAWDRGDYVPALEGFLSILKGEGTDRVVERVALATGELHPVRELASDGRSARFSSTGRFAVYETGSRTAPVARIVDTQADFKVVAELRGGSVVFSPDDDRLAYLAAADGPEAARLRAEIEKLDRAPAPDRTALSSLQRELAALEARQNALAIRDIATGTERRVATGGLLKMAPRFSADGRELYFVGASDAQAATDIYAVSEGSEPRPLGAGEGNEASVTVIPGGRYLAYATAAQSPFGGTTSGGRGGVGGAARQFGLLDLEKRETKTFAGSSPAVAANGSALAFVAQTGSEYTVQVVRLAGSLEPVTVKRGPERISSVALSPDGSLVAWAALTDLNFEIYCAPSSGGAELRVTREIQHDQAPMFLTSRKLVAIKGESRHSRSYLYDLESGAATRLFHNNTVRTIAPEYEWQAHPAGTSLLIQAERDGDTISPERGVYWLDLSRKVTRADLISRLERNLEAERRLRASGEALFKPIATQVRAVTDKVSISRIYSYEEALFAFDSKHITQPGNKLAGDFIHRMFSSFGYRPEYQWFEARGNIRTANVLATLRGTVSPDVVYVLSSHYDSNARCPGADDNSSATAVLLETARVLAGNPLPATIVFAAFTGEEAGLLGSREYVRQAVASKLNLAGALNNDMIGWTNDHHLDNTIRYSNAGIRDLQHAASFLFSRMVTYDARYFKSTDAAAYYDAYGDIVGGFGSYPVLGSPHYHQPSDLLETVNHHLLYEATKANVASIMALAASPARPKDLEAVRTPGGALEVTWSPASEKDVKGYRVTWGAPASTEAQARTVSEPRVTIPAAALRAAPGQPLEVAVVAINDRGMASWDAARARVGSDRD